jgi:TPR repeat protein
MYLTGTFKAYNSQRAFQINLQNANSGNAKAMNAVAIQYTKGLGVDSNFNLAVYWYTQAATNGYTKALVNLGMLYKHKASDSAAYSIACSYFNQALQANEPSAFFAQGYMLYKGLGCTQSYANALALFNQGILINQASCMYFKGLCFKFGYGITGNADSSNYYINKAALLGYKQANAEIYNNNQNTTASRGINKTQTTRNENNEKQETRNAVFERIIKTNQQLNLNGQFKGEILQYDYSGKKLIAQIPIILQVSTSNNIITGDLILNNSQSIKLKAIQQGNQLIFSQTTIQQTNNKTNNTKHQTPNNVFVFKSATLNLETKNDSNYLTGSLQLFNTYTHETEKPINIKLSQQKNSITDNPKPQTPNNVSIFPNPTNGNFTISFNLSKPSAVKINIYNQQGKIVYTKIVESLPQGKQNIIIDFSNSLWGGGGAGIYTAQIQTNISRHSTSFIIE